MPVPDQSQNVSGLRLRARSRWDDEGGAPPLHTDVVPLTPVELVQLRVRAIAVENLLIAMLAAGTDHQRKVARDMATYVAPRAGFRPHPLTIEAGRHMTALADRAEHFRSLDVRS